jgi:hypothetical protein
MTPQQRLLVLKIAAAAIVGLLLADRMIISPLSARWHEQSDRIDALKAKVQRGRQLIDREDSIRTHWADMVRANLPEEVAAAENQAFKAVGRWARDSQITFTSLTPQWQTHDGGYKTLECRVSADGNQATIGRFIYELETDSIPVNLAECELTTRDAHGSQIMFTARFNFLRLANTGGKKP